MSCPNCKLPEDCEACERFVCGRCQHVVGWQFGAHDANPTLCDTCAREVLDAVQADTPPACPECDLNVGTPIRASGADRWYGPRDANVWCPACGHGWVATPEVFAHSLKSYQAYEAKWVGDV